MAFPTDWTINIENANTLVAIESTTPIAGIGSLRTYISDASPYTERLTIQNNTYSNGLLAGRIRSVIRIDSLITDDFEHVGFACMQNSATASGVSDSGYAVTLSSDDSLGSPFVNILKYTSGFTAGATTLAIIAAGAVALTDPFVFQMDWVSDFSLLGGTLLRAYIGVSTTDFNDLVQVLEFTDTTAPILTSVTEGFLHTNLAGVAPDFDVKWDETSIFQLT